MNTLHTYIPQDRLRALVRGEALSDYANGAALFADLSGFTPLTEKLTQSLGARRGIEELTSRINEVYDAMISEVDRFGGSVISFSGDAITCWFDARLNQPPKCAVQCAQSIQMVMQRFPDLSIKIAVSTGAVRRFAPGDPDIRKIDALAGATIARLSSAEHLASAGEIILDQATIDILKAPVRESRIAETGEWFFVLDPSYVGDDQYSIPVDSAFNESLKQLDPKLLKSWILPLVYERETSGYDGLFLTELRPTTALFVRFMGIDYDNDTQAKEKLDTIITQTHRVINKNGGVLLELTIGDKGSYFYASFGSWQVHEDDSRRAVNVALELRQLFNEFGFLDSVQFGLSSGTMRVGAYGGTTRQSFGALGDDVNLAARLMMSAAPGEILISGRVGKAVADEFMLEARAPMPMKGKSERISVFATLGTQKHRAIRLQEPTYVLPMIGRRRELSVIAEQLTSVLRGQGKIIGITAEAGMGKSRLVAEGIRLARRSKLIGYGGACQSGGSNAPYLVWHSIWNAFFDLDPTSSSLRKQIRALERELEDRLPEHLDALPLLSAVLGLPLPDNDFTQALQPKDRKAQLETMLIKYIESAAREAAENGGGLLLVLEDLHWIDPVSFDLLEFVARVIENLPVLILLTYRPPGVGTLRNNLARLETLSHFTQISLTELSAAESEQTIRAKLSHLFPEHGGEVPPFLIERITSRAQGNPFYMEELLNYMHDRGIDPRDVAALNVLELPTSLHSIILSRIDQLTPSQQLSFKVASIIGRTFRFQDLHNYYPSLGTAEELKADLQMLGHLDLTPLESPEPELTYLFKHLVTHEVGYENIAYATRSQLHGLYARYLESTYPDRIEQLAPQLAHHFDQAQIHDKACVYLFKSGEQAAANYANDEALAYFTRALDLTPPENTRMRFDILLNRERVYDLLGMRAEQRQDLDELSQLVGQFDDAPILRAQIAIRHTKLEIDAGDYVAARSSAQAAIHEIEADAHTLVHSPELLVDALLLEARTMFLVGQAIAAKPQLDHALALARAHHYVRGEYNALAQLGLWSWYNGDNVGAAELLEQSLEQIRQAGDIRRELEILNNLGIVTKDMYQFTDALGYYERAQKIAKKIGDRSGEASLLNNMGRASLVSGDYVQADMYCAQAAALAAEVHDTTVQGLALHNRSESYRELGQYRAGKNAAEESLALVRSAGYRVGEANALENLAMIEFSLGDRTQALEYAQNALTIAREVSARRVEVSVLTRVGLMRLAMGQLDDAQQTLIEANNIEQELKDPIPMFEVQAGLAATALAHGGMESLEIARSQIRELVDEILREPPTEQSHILPMWLYLICIRVMHVQNDPRAAQMIVRAGAELRARFVKITDTSLQPAYMNIPEHRDITNFADMLPSEM